MLRRGYLYWVSLDKRRPALLLSPDVRNDKGRDVIVIPASTMMREGPWHVRLKKGEGGLAAPSVLLCEQIIVRKLKPMRPSMSSPVARSNTWIR